MPTYEYSCRDCGEQIEVVQAMSDPPISTCPLCGGPMRRVYSPVGIVFKGSGFYKTDSRSAAQRGKKDAGKEAGKDAGKKDGDKVGAAAGSKDGTGSGDGGSKDAAGAGSKAAGPGSSRDRAAKSA